MFSPGSDRTNLRAEVPPFVPRREWPEGSMEQHNGGPLPRYVTTCYPFVQDNQDRHPAQIGINMNQRMANQNMRNSYSSVNYLSNNPNPATQLTNANTQMGMVQQNFSAQLFSGNLADTAHITAVYGDSFQCQYPPNQTSMIVQKTSSLSRSSSRGSGKKILKRNVGTQKEVSRRSPVSPEMVDSCQQTDFPMSVACKSLTDHPSSLRRATKSRRRRETCSSQSGNCDSSSDHADADVDSDSGPKHRLGHKRNGGTSTNGLWSRNEKDPVPQVIYITPTNVAPPVSLFQVHSSAHNHMFPNSLPPQVTPPPNSLLGYGHPGPPIILSPPPNQILANRPTPPFPIHPSMIGNRNPNQCPSNNNWNINQLALPPGYWPNNSTHPPQHRHQTRNPSLDFRHQRNLKKFEFYGEQPYVSAAGSQFLQGHFDKRKHDKRKTVDEVPSRERSPVVMQTHEQPNTNNLHFHGDNSMIMLSDTQEFPGLDGNFFSTSSSPSINAFSYSAAVMGKIPRPIAPINSSAPYPSSAANLNEKSQAQKTKKRRKKAERAARAADEEYAEISKEQENIQKVLKKTASSRNKNKNQVLDLGEFLTSKFEEKKLLSDSPTKNTEVAKSWEEGHLVAKPPLDLNMKIKPTGPPANALDSTAPLIKKGKEREVPKPKKPSALKKVILKEREEKKEHHLKQLTTMLSPETDVPPYPPALYKIPVPSDDEKSLGHDTNTEVSVSIPPTVPQIHSRRYREYCCQVLDKRVDEMSNQMLQRLVYFQDRLYKTDPAKAKRKRRVVLGFREVTKHLKMKKLRCVIISPNLEKIESKGGLDDVLHEILDLCKEQNIPYVFALGKKALGRAVSKTVPVSIVGVFDYSGAEAQFKQLVELVKEAQLQYKDMVQIYQKQVAEANKPVQSAGPSKRYAYMTHSRNASATSHLSVTSIISEPISEMNEGSNWRVIMDAGEDGLSPPPEDDVSEEEEVEESPGKEKPAPPVPVKGGEELSRKDSGSTVVECPHPELQPDDNFVSELPGEEESSSVDAEDAEEMNLNHRRALDKSFSTCSTLKPEGGVSPRISTTSESSSLIPDDVSSQSSAQDRIQLWLEDATRSVVDLDLNDVVPDAEDVNSESKLVTPDVNESK
uniref:selenocysteine insertion sequence-binding protein 2-like isoform X2 n=1 Tax=Ciona intestinalis TaxID=7719 RepID=UPI00089DC46F|nr:selenocysteine insertion sequence-binding protein 2-like isoform X2 [Ciona intestinalis]|eukprot:XP_026689530.1 selenocysteine insertion sequence-binding protein 2-like isoform X2 [Ciona intestinalis]